jgi:hypothetical protein
MKTNPYSLQSVRRGELLVLGLLLSSTSAFSQQTINLPLQDIRFTAFTLHSFDPETLSALPPFSVPPSPNPPPRFIEADLAGGPAGEPIAFGGATITITNVPQQILMTRDTMANGEAIPVTPFDTTVKMDTTWTPASSALFGANRRVMDGPAWDAWNPWISEGNFGGVAGVPVALTHSKVFSSTPLQGSQYTYSFEAVCTTQVDGGLFVVFVEFVYSIVPSEVRVDTLDDEDDGDFAEGDQSLREALVRASFGEADAIAIEAAGTILLENGPLTLPGGSNFAISLVPFAGPVTIAGDDASRILEVPSGSFLEILGIEFSGGGADDAMDSQGGGAILNHGNLSLRDCSFTFNHSSHGGGAILTSSSAETFLRECLFSDNYANNDFGSTLYIEPGGHLNALNCAILNSSGAVQNLGSCVLKHCTLYNGDALLKATGGRITMSHCIVAGGNRRIGSADLVISPGAELESFHYNAIEVTPPLAEWTPGADIVNRKLMLFESGGGGVFMLPFSPCVNAGYPLLVAGAFTPPLLTDVLGNQRFVGIIDIGALEVSSATLDLADVLINGPGGDLNGNGVPDLVDAFSGIDPKVPSTEPPVVIVPPGGSPPPALADGDVPAVNLLPGTTIVETRIDERVTQAEGTLQTSPDLITWTDRATYKPQGAGLGYSRTLVNGATFLEDEKVGLCWLIREQISTPTGRLFVRMKATQLP